jgi:RES domain-containing protein
VVAPKLSRFDGIAYRGIAGIKPLWSAPNLIAGRFNAPSESRRGRPTQYLSLHPMGPLAEFLRHTPVAATDIEAIRRNLFVLRLAVDNVLHVTFDNANELGLAADALIDDDWSACQQWADDVLDAHPVITGLRVPSAALPGTENLVLFGAATPIAFDAVPRRPRYLPTALAMMDGHPHAELLRDVRWTGTAQSLPADGRHIERKRRAGSGR